MKQSKTDIYIPEIKVLLNDEGYLTITGRIKDIFKTAKGKYVAPNPIEMKLSKSSFIEQVCICW